LLFIAVLPTNLLIAYTVTVTVSLIRHYDECLNFFNHLTSLEVTAIISM